MAQADTQGDNRTGYEPQTKGVLNAVAEECSELDEAGESPWVEIAPTTDEQEVYNRRREKEAYTSADGDGHPGENNLTGIILGNYIDEAGRLGDPGEEYPIKGGFKMETREHSEDVVYEVWRTSKYVIHYKIESFEHPEYGDVAVGLVRVELADS